MDLKKINSRLNKLSSRHRDLLLYYPTKGTSFCFPDMFWYSKPQIASVFGFIHEYTHTS